MPVVAVVDWPLVEQAALLAQVADWDLVQDFMAIQELQTQVGAEAAVATAQQHHHPILT
jgi:hypothetical protein